MKFRLTIANLKRCKLLQVQLHLQTKLRDLILLFL
jgi:hypothetical protein